MTFSFHQYRRRLPEKEQAAYYYDVVGYLADQQLDPDKAPVTIKILLENVLRNHHRNPAAKHHLSILTSWLRDGQASEEIAYYPSRVLMQDFTAVPAVVDLAAMRDAAFEHGANPKTINPQCPVDLVIDHSVQVNHYGNSEALAANTSLEMQRESERYQLLKWAQQAFSQFRVVPPGNGICHQVNLEYLAPVVQTQPDKDGILAYPDTLVGTDSHTTMINGLGVLGWGVGGIEAEAVMLGEPIGLNIPPVVGFKLQGRLPHGATATDMVLHITRMCREHGVVGKFIEFYGTGTASLTLAERATIANMSPEFGATCSFFAIDDETLRYMRLTARDDAHVDRTATYARLNGLWHDPQGPEPDYPESLTLDLSTIQPSVAGPKRPQDQVLLGNLPEQVRQSLGSDVADLYIRHPVASQSFDLGHADVVIAAITSCTNTSNPSILITAALVAQNAIAKGLTSMPWVKTSFAPGSVVVSTYMQQLGMLEPLEALGFHVVGFGCTTCIGNSGPLDDAIAQTIQDKQLQVSSVLSGNRNFEGRIHPQVKMNFLASPPLVVAYAIAGTTHIDLDNQPLGHDTQGNPVYLADLWPDKASIDALVHQIDQQMFMRGYHNIFEGTAAWENLPISQGDRFDWQEASHYVQRPNFIAPPSRHAAQHIEQANILAILGDSVTTDHISPAGAIKADSPAGKYLQSHGVPPEQFNSYGSRRGNHHVMLRGTFANIRIRNLMTPDLEGGYTVHQPTQEQVTLYEASQRYQQARTPLVIFAGKEYGTGSSRDWAAKGTRLMGVQAVIAESFERIHRANLVGMGVMPIQLQQTLASLELTGSETVSITSADGEHLGHCSNQALTIAITRSDGSVMHVHGLSRIDTDAEARYYQNDGILPTVVSQLTRAHTTS